MKSRASDARLWALTRRFDYLLERMHAPKTRRALKAAIDASPDELGKATVEAARKNEG